MYSKDVESIIAHIHNIRDTMASIIIDLCSENVKYRIYNEEHVHELYNPVAIGNGFGIAYGACLPTSTRESEIGPDYTPITITEFLQPIQEAYNDIKTDLIKMTKVENNLYDQKEKITNSYGSPWAEYDNLDYIVKKIIEFGTKNPILKYTNEKRSFIDLIQLGITCANDCKWAVIYYHDIVSRGYDEVHNNKQESIQWENNTPKNKDGKKGSNFVKNDPSNKNQY